MKNGKEEGCLVSWRCGTELSRQIFIFKVESASEFGKCAGEGVKGGECGVNVLEC
jgi:hypothetical protein